MPTSTPSLVLVKDCTNYNVDCPVVLVVEGDASKLDIGSIVEDTTTPACRECVVKGTIKDFVPVEEVPHIVAPTGCSNIASPLTCLTEAGVRFEWDDKKHGDADGVSRIPCDPEECDCYDGQTVLSKLPCGGCVKCKKQHEDWLDFVKLDGVVPLHARYVLLKEADTPCKQNSFVGHSIVAYIVWLWFLLGTFVLSVVDKSSVDDIRVGAWDMPWVQESSYSWQVFSGGLRGCYERVAGAVKYAVCIISAVSGRVRPAWELLCECYERVAGAVRNAVCIICFVLSGRVRPTWELLCGRYEIVAGAVNNAVCIISAVSGRVRPAWELLQKNLRKKWISVLFHLAECRMPPVNRTGHQRDDASSVETAVVIKKYKMDTLGPTTCVAGYLHQDTARIQQENRDSLRIVDGARCWKWQRKKKKLLRALLHFSIV